MNDQTGNRIQPDDGGETLSGAAILAILALIALVCTAGYFFLMKMVDVSQQDDCFLAQRRNCGPASGPFRQ